MGVAVKSIIQSNFPGCEYHIDSVFNRLVAKLMDLTDVVFHLAAVGGAPDRC